MRIPSDEDSGGTWEVVGKSTDSGISGISALLTNITTAQALRRAAR